jgi:hypothetical protein
VFSLLMPLVLTTPRMQSNVALAAPKESLSGRGLPVIGHEARHSNIGIDLSTGSQAIGCPAFNNRGIGID